MTTDDPHPEDSPSLARKIFTEALNYSSEEERRQFLAQACGDNAELHSLVLRLLRAHEEVDDFLEPTLFDDPSLVGESPGAMIGHYQLLERIGEGGFGTVWAAEQKEPVRRRVALKIIKLGMDTKQVVARFEAERQALAMMDHPNVAKVHDAGATETGRPYFVMEMVRGEKITDYCDHHRLGPAERLQLIIQVCQAVQHAHQKGLIHRDIKPSNILVTKVDGQPIPKVIDFGIAKATGGRLTDKTVYTALNQIVGTPTYMSPEQADIGREDIDTRTDIYSLGVVLYELLTGLTPFDERELARAGLDGIRRSICEQEPPRPSTRLSTAMPEDLSALARSRSAEPAHLIRALRDDLDWIVMKCLEKERSRRYDTAEGLARDLLRHLNHEAVLARPPSVMYRLQKTVRRHKVFFAAASAVFLALATAAGVFLDSARKERANALREKANALRLQHDLARQYLRQGQALAENGDVARGLHWMARSHEEVPESSPKLQHVIEENLVAWSQDLVEPDKVIFEGGWIHSADMSEDGKWIVTGRNGKISLWSVENGEKLHQRMDYDTTGGTPVDISPDGKRVIAGYLNGLARLYNLPDLEPLAQEMVHEKEVTSARFSHNGKNVGTASADGMARVWDAATGEPVTPPLQHEMGIYGPNAMAFSPDDRLIVTGSWDGNAKVWSIETGEQVIPPLHHEDSIYVVAFEPTGKWIAISSIDGMARFWSVATGEPVGHPMWHHDWVFDVSFNPIHNTFATACLDGMARLWEVPSGRSLGQLMRHGEAATSVVFSPDGRNLAAAGFDASARLYSAETGVPTSLPFRHQEFVWKLKYDQKGTTLMTMAGADRTLIIWKAPWVIRGLVTIPHTDNFRTIQFAPDGKTVAMAGIHNGWLRFHSVATGEQLLELGEMQHEGGIRALDFSRDGSHLLSGGGDGTARLWNCQNGEYIVLPIQHEGAINAAVFSPDETKIATAGQNKTARIWDAETGMALTPPMVHPDVVHGVRWTPDGERIITACGDGTARIWEVETGIQLPREFHHSDIITGLDISPDGRWLATASWDKTARIWNLEKYDEPELILAHKHQVEDVAFSPDGKWLLTTSIHNVRIWSVATGEKIGPVMKHPSSVRDGEFSPDGKLVAGAADFRHNSIWTLWKPTKSPLPKPRLWIEVISHATLDDAGTLSWLDNETWEEKSEALQRLGGRPVSNR